MVRTVWVLGDQLNRQIGAMRDAVPGQDRVLLVESRAKLEGTRHRQRTHLVVTALRRFAGEVAAEGFDVDLRKAPTLAAGLVAHRREHRPTEVVATEPNSWNARALLRRLDVGTVLSDQFLCHPDEFSSWADGRGGKLLRLEDFYRWQRTRLGVLIDGPGEPAGGRWNFDDENCEYWDFLDRHRARFERNPRMAQAVRGLDRLSDLAEVRIRARQVTDGLATGTI